MHLHRSTATLIVGIALSVAMGSAAFAQMMIGRGPAMGPNATMARPPMMTLPPRGMNQPPSMPPGMRNPGRTRGPVLMIPLGPQIIETAGDDLPPRRLAGPPKKSPPAKGPSSAAPRGPSGAPPANERRYVPDELLITVPSGFTAQAADALAARMRLVRLEQTASALGGTTVFRWRIPDRRSVPAVIRALEALPGSGILFAQPNYLYALAQDSQTNASAAPAGPPQYALAKMRLQQAHAISRGDKVLVAVIDSGIDMRHPELDGMIADSFDATGTGEPPHVHGTAIAGAIVAHARLLGIAPAARILAVRAFGSTGASADATTFAILKGLDWSAAKGAQVINMSFAGPADPAMGRSLAAARTRGIVLVAAAGNAGPKSAPLYPAADRNVIAVTATNADDKLFPGANRGRHIAVAAPGVDLIVPAPNGAYQIQTGTSFSAALVSGTVALLLGSKPGLSPDAVRSALTGTALDLGPVGNDDQFGAGLVDAHRAVLSVTVQAADTATAIPAAAR